MDLDRMPAEPPVAEELPPLPQTPLPYVEKAPQSQVDFNSTRARHARIARRVGDGGYALLVFLTLLFAGFAAACWYLGYSRVGFLSMAAAIIVFIPAAWYHLELKPQPISGSTLTDRISGEILSAFPAHVSLNPQLAWQTMQKHWHFVFYANHFLVTSDTIISCLGNRERDMDQVWHEAARLADETKSPLIEPGHLAGALLTTSADFRAVLTHMKMAPTDAEAVAMWLGRALEVFRTPKPYFGGLGRDWANGFTPKLNEFGYNISLSLEQHGGHFGWLTTSPGVQAIKNAFSQGMSAVGIIGEPGVGKTSHIYALAQLLLEEKDDRNLEHRQIVSLNPSTILSSAKRPGELEEIVMTLLIEASHAGNIILFLDDAQLFFRSGPGSFDMTQILLPVLQSRAVQMVMAMTPHDYQQLKINSASFANLMTPVILNEPAEENVMRVLEDSALSLEHRHHVLIPYEALREAYRLSGRYVQDAAYPGKALQLLENAISYREHGNIVTAVSVQSAVEQTRGVRVSAAAPAEADSLLHLEDKIHERMINQTYAVKVVASALRRARAGVSNPRRPIGSFLFLGPTGVGKTELAKAVAATYFNAESSIIRLDMSEYQQPDDVRRLLSNGAEESHSLIMAVRQQPFAVVLLDEIEKAHPNILNLLLQLLDEGQLTDVAGKPASFKDCVIIATSNAGANSIRERVGSGEELASFQEEFTDELISSGQFKPELLNRFDEIVLFRPLNEQELAQVVRLMVADINQTLANQNISVELTPAAIAQVVATGYDPRLGARPMRRALQRAVEDGIAGRILRGETHPGDHVVLDVQDLS
jgi:ATP-dependent Clp protease ATP-binding subunit ClpC